MKQSEAIDLLLDNRRLFLETLVEVQGKDRHLVPLILNPIQSDMEETSWIRDIYIKPAQIGGSTYFIADFLCDCLTVPGTVSVIISYDDFSATRLLLKAKMLYKAMKRKVPSWDELEHKSANLLSFKKTGSSFYIFSARSFVMGRGEAIHNLLLDEYAFWPEGAHEDVVASAVQRVPMLPNTKIRILSTPNGEDNEFCTSYKDAKEGKEVGQSVYKSHFYPWYMHPEFTMAADDEFCLPGDESITKDDLKPEEIALMLRWGQIGIDNEEAFNKIRFRRYKKVEMASRKAAGKSVLSFQQEYPEDDVSCFIVAGDQAYDPDLITSMIRLCYPAPLHHTVTGGRSTSAGVDIWEEPKEGAAYLLSIDPGKGKTSESVGQVWRFVQEYENKEGKWFPPEHIHCATIAGYYEEDEMADYCKELGRYYNLAVIAPEDNLDIVSHLKDYPELYYREDPRNEKVGMSVGWQTNQSTKPYMITELNANMQYIHCFDARFWEQCRNVRRDRTVKTGIVVVGSDDHHDCGGIAIVCRRAAPIHSGYVGKYGWQGDWGRDLG